MWSFNSQCDEFTVSTKIALKLDLDPSRETLLHFFEQVRRAFPELIRFRRKEDGGIVLDEDERPGMARRFVRLEMNAVRFGAVSAPDADTIHKLSDVVLTQAPVHLSLSDLDYEHLEVVLGFDLEYQGNHDEIIAETLFGEHPLYSTMTGDGHGVIECQPVFGIALSEDCAVQAYVEVRSATTTSEVRAGEYEAGTLSVYLTLRRYWSPDGAIDLRDAHRDMLKAAILLAEERVVPLVVQPLAAAIATRR